MIGHTLKLVYMISKQSIFWELANAATTLASLTGETVDSITVSKVPIAEISFLAQIVSKLSPMVGNLMEQRIVSVLQSSAGSSFTWVRQDPGFPDAVLKNIQTDEILAGYEIKAWFVLSTEITGRFRESINLLQDKNINVVIVAWCMSHLVYGTPKILGILIVSAEELAKSRDLHYHMPPKYLTIEPNDTTSRTSNLQQSNVNGFRLQEEISDESLVEAALSHVYTSARPHTPEAQREAQELMVNLSYRLDTNFAKIDRVANRDVELFKAEIFDTEYLDRSISDWKRIFSDLTSANERKRRNAEAILEKVCDSLTTEEIKKDLTIESPGAH